MLLSLLIWFVQTAPGSATGRSFSLAPACLQHGPLVFKHILTFWHHMFQVPLEHLLPQLFLRWTVSQRDSGSFQWRRVFNPDLHTSVSIAAELSLDCILCLLSPPHPSHHPLVQVVTTFHLDNCLFMAPPHPSPAFLQDPPNSSKK